MQKLPDVNGVLLYHAASIDDVLNSRRQIADDYTKMHPHAKLLDFVPKGLARILRREYVASSAAVISLPPVHHNPGSDPTTSMIMEYLDPRTKLNIKDYSGQLEAVLPYGPQSIAYKLLGSNTGQYHKQTDWQSTVLLFARVNAINDEYVLFIVEKIPAPDKKEATMPLELSRALSQV